MTRMTTILKNAWRFYESIDSNRALRFAQATMYLCIGAAAIIYAVRA